MLEPHMIQTQGFRNVTRDGTVVGFQLRIRIPYYRGIWASLIEGAEVTVDGEEFPADTIVWTIGNRTLTLPQIQESTDLRWPFDEPAVLTVPKPGGLAVGVHDVTVSLAWRASYLPPDMGPWTVRTQRKLTLTR